MRDIRSQQRAQHNWDKVNIHVENKFLKIFKPLVISLFHAVEEICCVHLGPYQYGCKEHKWKAAQ